MDLLPIDKDPFRSIHRVRHSFWWYLRRVLLVCFLLGIGYTVVMLNRACSYDNRYDDLTLTALSDVKPIAIPHAKRPTLGIAFGGGGVRGFMHLGAIKALEEAGIKADIVVGSSAGAIVAAIYATGQSFDEMLTSANSMDGDKIYAVTLNKRGVVSGRAISDWVRQVTDDARIENLDIPAGFTVTDLQERTVLLATRGSVGEAVQASVSIPGVFIPVKSQNRLLVDGGVFSLVPVNFTRAMGADIVIGIDIYCGAKPEVRDFFANTLVVATRLQNCKVSRVETDSADFVVRPTFEPENFGNFSAQQALIEAGYEEMQKKLPELIKQLQTVH